VPTKPPAPQTKACDFCGETILATAKKCKHCGEILDLALRASLAPTPQQVSQPAAIQITNVNTNVVGYAPVKRWSPLVAFILSFFLPGLGQCYKGQVINGIVWFVVVVIGYVMLIVPGIVLHICCAIGASLGDPYR
jgi:TM2 domain-containing membrane protein YozV